MNKNSYLKVFLLIVTLSMLVSCSSKQMYDNAQSMERNKCTNGPANDYHACLQRNSMSYEEYGLARKESKADG